MLITTYQTFTGEVLWVGYELSRLKKETTVLLKGKLWRASKVTVKKELQTVLLSKFI